MDWNCSNAVTLPALVFTMMMSTLPERQTDLRAMEAWLAPRFAGRSVLEIACGTGWWTPHGAAQARRWLATDLNPETMAVARTKALPRRSDGREIVEFRAVDAYTLAEVGDERFDGAFAGCWWSHVALQRLPDWLATLHVGVDVHFHCTIFNGFADFFAGGA